MIKQYLPDGGILECSYDDVNGKTYLRDQNGTVSSYESDVGEGHDIKEGI